MKRIVLAWMMAAVATAAPPVRGGRTAAAYSEARREGERLITERRWDQAEAALVRALAYRDSAALRSAIRKCRVNSRLERGAALLAAGNHAGAAEQYRQALDLDPANAAAVEGLRAAQYRFWFREGTRALAERSPDRARRAFERCLELRPGDEAAGKQLRDATRESAAAGELRAAIRRIDVCLLVDDAECVEREVPRLPPLASALVRVPHSEMPLLPALLHLARGDARGAERLATEAGTAAAVHFRDYVRCRRRMEAARRWAGWTALAYAATLLAGLFYGVREVSR
jgi:tetratricopeptide (TPR) repeat protein